MVHGVIHYCVPNIPSMVPFTASRALSNVTGPLMRSIGDAGGVEHAIRGVTGMRSGVYLFNGIPVNRLISDYFSLPYQNIELLLAAWQ
jgi:alanine dehydrogenase